MTILDIQLDSADAAALARVNEHFKLNVPRARSLIWQESVSNWRDRVRKALRDKWKTMAEYPKDLDPRKLTPHFSKHMLAMTVEDLNSKADIAVQLAWRDQRIEQLESELTATKAQLATYVQDSLTAGLRAT